MIKKLLYTLLTFSFALATAQVKIGNRPSVIDPASVLELESSDKFLVITRMTSAQMMSATPLEGAMVYNTDLKCVYVYRNPSWKSLCEGAKIIESATAPASPQLGDLWVNGNTTYGWNGSKWVLISKSIINGTGKPSTTVTNPKAGDLYVDKATGDLYTYNGTTWVNQTQIKADNGLTYDKTKNTVSLGGALTKPTVITTDTNNNLSIKGLQQGNPETDEIVTVNKTTGKINKLSITNMLRRDEFVITIGEGKIDVNTIDLTTEGKKIFSDKVDVYRNGVKIGVTIDKKNNIITINSQEAYCCEEDRIRIVQFY